MYCVFRGVFRGVFRAELKLDAEFVGQTSIGLTLAFIRFLL